MTGETEFGTKQIQSLVHAVAKPRGFRRKGSSWFREQPEVIEVINLQKSPWGPKFYLNLGVALRGLDPGPSPRIALCHLHGRVERTGPRRELVEKIMDMESTTFSQEERSEAISNFVRDGILWLESVNSKEKMRKFLSLEESVWFAVLLTGRRFLGLIE